MWKLKGILLLYFFVYSLKMKILKALAEYFRFNTLVHICLPIINALHFKKIAKKKKKIV